MKRAETSAGRSPEAAKDDDLLATGVARFLPGAALEEVPLGYARITHALADRTIPPGEPPGEEGQVSSLALVDIESLGFIGRPLFLIGALYATAGEEQRESAARWNLEIIQYLARDYSEEEAVLRAFQEDAGEVDLWITYNGRTFDLPFIKLRAVHYRLPEINPRRHIDLLPVARRLWGRELPDCRLKTIERLVTRRPRPDGDIAGGRIPEAYHAFVRTGEPFDMLDILRHNAADLTGLLDIYLMALHQQGE